MKLKQKQLARIILAAIVLGFILEAVLRPHVISQSMADLLYRAKRYTAAEKVFTHNAIKRDGIASANLAKSLYKQEKYSEAETHSEEALNQSPNKQNRDYDSGNIAYQQGDYKNALEHYRKAMLQNNKDMDAKANYELTLRKIQNQPPKQEPEKEKDPKKQEEIRNILGGLDNKESSDRKQQNPQQELPPTKWW